MIITSLPHRNEWEALCERPQIKHDLLENIVMEILNNVLNNGDEALRHYAKKYDGTDLQSLIVKEAAISKAAESITPELKEAIALAMGTIERFHASQKETTVKMETTQGVQCWRESVAIEKVGLYIPGGTAPLFSTILMLGIPARLAGCKEIILCTPPDNQGDINPAILYTAQLVGINKICKVGGAQAIAAMAYGTEQIPKVYKIFGPGNQYVTKAKELVQRDGVAIDIPAGPSELLVIADETSNPAFVAADLLSQAEHGSDSQVILLSNSDRVIVDTLFQLKKQLDQLPRKSIAEKSLANSRAIRLNSLDECIEFANYYAPEHLIIASEKANQYVGYIVNAGSVFLGNYSCESAGDYASGTNHTLPTNGFARNYSGVSLDSFVRKITFQQISADGIRNIGPAIELMAEAEQLFAHKNAVTLRLNSLQND